MSRVLFACVVAVCGWTVVATGQQAQSSFRGAVDLVTLDVTVLDDDSRPVAGLSAEDFEVKLNGRVQPVKVVSFLKLGPPELGAPEAGPPALAGATVADGGAGGARPVVANSAVPESEPRLFVVLVDDLSLDPTRGRGMMLAAQQFVKQLPGSDLVGFATTSGIASVNPSTFRAPVLEALGKATGQFLDPRTARPPQLAGDGASDTAIGLMQALRADQGDTMIMKSVIAQECFNGDRSQVERLDISGLVRSNNCAAYVQREMLRTVARIKEMTARQAQAMASIIDSMRTAPGFKQLVIISDGLAVANDVGPLRVVSRAAARAGVRINMLVEDQDMDMRDGGRRDAGAADVGMAQRHREDSLLLREGAATTALMAGGQMFRVIGDPDPFFARVARASAAVYRLGIEPLADSTPGREFSVEVKVKNRKGISVAANRVGIIPEAVEVDPTAPAKTMDERLTQALSAGETHLAIPIAVGTILRRAGAMSGDHIPLQMVVEVQLPASVTGPFLTMYGLVDAEGRMAGGRSQVPASGVGQPTHISFVLPVESGRYRLRFAVGAANGELGSVDVPIDATLAKVGPFVASDVLAAWFDDGGQGHLLTLQGLPVGTPNLQASVELYATNGEGPADEVRVDWSIARSGEASPLAHQEVVAAAAGDVRQATAEFATADLDPGVYVIRATVRSGSRELGVLMRTIEVTGA